MKSHNPNSVKWLRDRGYETQVVERWNAFGFRPGGGKGIRQDLFGFVDIFGIRDGKAVGVQATSKGHLSDHRKKIESITTAATWLRAGLKLYLQGWYKLKNRWRVDTYEAILLKGINWIPYGNQDELSNAA